MTARARWRPLLWVVPAALVLVVCAVLVARWAVTQPGVRGFIERYPGHAASWPGSPVGVPAWLAWQHFLNLFFMVLLIRAGIAVRTTARPKGYWTRKNTGLLHTKRPPKKISLIVWRHLTIDTLWIANGLIFAVLLVTTGQWKRLVPANLEVFPEATSVALQYLSLSSPAEDTWVGYNALQLLAYFLTVFIAAPLAALTGWRLSGAWPSGAQRLSKVFRIEVARAIHFPVMIYFVAFIVVHVGMVLATGARTNLAHMFAARDDGSWLGVVMFGIAILVTAVGLVGTREVFLRPLAQLTGKVTR